MSSFHSDPRLGDATPIISIIRTAIARSDDSIATMEQPARRSKSRVVHEMKLEPERPLEVIHCSPTQRGVIGEVEAAAAFTDRIAGRPAAEAAPAFGEHNAKLSRRSRGSWLKSAHAAEVSNNVRVPRSRLLSGAGDVEPAVSVGVQALRSAARRLEETMPLRALPRAFRGSRPPRGPKIWDPRRPLNLVLRQRAPALFNFLMIFWPSPMPADDHVLAACRAARFNNKRDAGLRAKALLSANAPARDIARAFVLTIEEVRKFAVRAIANPSAERSMPRKSA